MSEPKRKSLGRGLSALLGEEKDETPPPRAATGAAPHHQPVGILMAGRMQPRRHFDAEALAALVDSVREKGVLQPLLVRPHPEITGAYEIIAGERRWRAAQQAGLHEVPVVIRELDDRAALEIALIENVQRQDLSPLEEAEGYQRLIDEFGHTQQVLSQAVGKSRSHVANMLRLLGLPDAVRTLLAEGKLSVGHARALLGAADPARLAAEIVRRDLNVRQAEALAVGGRGAGIARPRKPAPPHDANTARLERDLGETLGLKVSITTGEGERGTLAIHYRTLDQLDDVMARLRGELR
jgi:ParB family chromosome partitioning protein